MSSLSFLLRVSLSISAQYKIFPSVEQLTSRKRRFRICWLGVARERTKGEVCRGCCLGIPEQQLQEWRGGLTSGSHRHLCSCLTFFCLHCFGPVKKRSASPAIFAMYIWMRSASLLWYLAGSFLNSAKVSQMGSKWKHLLPDKHSPVTAQKRT